MQSVHTIIAHVAVHLCLRAFYVNPVVARFSIRDWLLNVRTRCLINKQKMATFSIVGLYLSYMDSNPASRTSHQY